MEETNHWFNLKVRSATTSGFTLVELLLVIAIIGILASVLFVAMGSQRKRARLTAFKSGVRGNLPAWITCTDSGGSVKSGSADGSVAICSGGSISDNYPEITDCDGEGNARYLIQTGDNNGDYWYIGALCDFGGGRRCYARCDTNGCDFCDSLDGDWNGVNCGKDSNNCN